jgi:SAM-dependent methyltransferase
MTQTHDGFEVPYSGAPVETVVEVLKELAGRGRVLELGVGTGRIALPLAAAGVTVTGIDSSGERLEVLHAKPGGDDLPVLLGNFRDLQGGPYDLVYAVDNALLRLLDQDDQVACFANVGQALAEGGIFIVETALEPPSCPGGTRVSVSEVSAERVIMRVGTYDSIRQLVSGALIIFSDGGVRTIPDLMRYTPAAELDLMARLAGLTLKDRWGDWQGNPVTSRSAWAISLYELRTTGW